MSHHTAEQLEAVQHAVERVAANWDGAEEGFVEARLREALGETGVDVPDQEVTALATAIEENRGTVDAAALLGH